MRLKNNIISWIVQFQCANLISFRSKSKYFNKNLRTFLLYPSEKAFQAHLTEH